MSAIPNSVVAVNFELPADVRNQLCALAGGALLRKAYTGYSYQQHRWLERIGRRVDTLFGTSISKHLSRRPELVGVESSHLDRVWLAEAIGLALLRLPGSQHAKSYYSDWLQKCLSQHAARQLLCSDKVVVAREFQAQEVFATAEALGIYRIYQLPTPHYRTVDRILRRELDLYPDSEMKLVHERSVKIHRINRKEAELTLANEILVPSLFVKKSLESAGCPGSVIKVLPFGCEQNWISESITKRLNGPFLHVGHLSIRKGTHRLLRAWKKLGAYRTCELRLVGKMHLSEKFLTEFKGMYNHLGRMPREGLRHQYAQASCFVLPALAEGFAVVLLESLSCGTPIVASRNSGAEGFVQEGEHGILHDAQDDDQLCNALEWMLSHPQQRIDMSECCLQKARSWTWRDYQAAFTDHVAGLVGTAR